VPKNLGELFDGFEREAFRLETLDDYSKSGNVGAYKTFLAGGIQPDDYNDAWVAELHSHTSQGKRIYRVHVLARPLTPYLRFELGWGYHKNAAGGEEFYILDITEQANPLAGAPDFWLFDESIAARLSYAEDGSFRGVDVLPEDCVAEFIAYRDTALAHAVPFLEWWAKYADE
jgi:hypothetical protein